MIGMQFSFFNSKPAASPIAVFSIESGCIVLTIIDFDKDRKGELVYISRVSLESDVKLAPQELLRYACQKIDGMLKRLFDEKHTYAIARAKVLVILGSPWHISWSDKVLVKKERNFRVTENLINDSISESFNTTHKGMIILGKRIESVKMNGYQMKNPTGKSTASLELDVYIESAPSEVLVSVSEAIRKHIPHASISWSVYTFAAVSAIKECLGVKDFLLVIPEHEVTEIALVQNGIVQAEASLPWGSSSLARNLFGKKSSGIKEAISKTKRFITGTLSQKDQKSTSIAIEAEKKNFFLNFRNILWQMNTSVLFPDTVFIAGKTIAGYFAAEWIKKENYSGETFTIGGFKCTVLGGGDIGDSLLRLKEMKSKFPFVSAVSALAAKSFEISLK